MAAGAWSEHDESWRAAVVACGVAAASVCVGGLAAIVAAWMGASAMFSLSLMASFVLGGAVVAAAIAQRPTTETSPPEPRSMLERQLSERYGVPVQRLAWHVWDIDGELVEATFDTSTGYLSSGGEQLRY